MVSDFVACYRMYLGSTISFYNFDNEGSIDFVACYRMYWEGSRAWLRLGDFDSWPFNRNIRKKDMFTALHIL